MTDKGLAIIKKNIISKGIFVTKKNNTASLNFSDSDFKYLNKLSGLLSGFVKKNFKINLNKENFDNLVLNVYSGFKTNQPNTGGNGDNGDNGDNDDNDDNEGTGNIVPYQPQTHTEMTKNTSKKSGFITSMCNNMNSYDIKVIGIFVVACILIYLGYNSLDEMTTSVMGKNIVTITNEILVENSIFQVPSTIINLITKRITDQSQELFNTASSEISSNVAAVCSTNAGIVNTLFTTNSYTSCVTAQTTTELARITAQQTYYMTTP
jgi:hypothetical protein